MVLCGDKSQHCVTKKIDKESCYTPFVDKILPYPKVAKHRRVPLRNVMVPRYKQTSTENRDITFSCKKYFDMSEISKTLNCSPMETFSTVKQTYFDRESCCTFFVHKIFRYQKVVEHRRVPLRSFPVLWDKKIAVENRDKPLLFCVAFFDTRNYLKHRKVPQRFFFGTGRQNIFDKNVISPLSCKNFSKFPKLVKFKMVPLWHLSAQWDKKISTENCVIPLLCTEVYNTRI